MAAVALHDPQTAHCLQACGSPTSGAVHGLSQRRAKGWLFLSVFLTQMCLFLSIGLSAISCSLSSLLSPFHL